MDQWDRLLARPEDRGMAVMEATGSVGVSNS